MTPTPLNPSSILTKFLHLLLVEHPHTDTLLTLKRDSPNRWLPDFPAQTILVTRCLLGIQVSIRYSRIAWPRVAFEHGRLDELECLGAEIQADVGIPCIGLPSNQPRDF